MRKVMANKKKRVPEGATQHVTAGPYSPVLEVECNKLVVISGQTCIAPDGSIPTMDFAGQARLTLENCKKQLLTAGCGFEDVFKVNVYMKDLAFWEKFNGIYQDVIPRPRPVRTAVQAVLLEGILIEVEMWAAKE